MGISEVNMAAKTYKGKSLSKGGGGRFARLSDKLKRKGVNNPDALAASIGRKKYGKNQFQKMAAAGKKRRGVPGNTHYENKVIYSQKPKWY